MDTRDIQSDDHVLLVCPNGYFGEPSCQHYCANGYLAGKMCICEDTTSHRYFGQDCSQEVVITDSGIPDTWVQANSEFGLHLVNQEGAGISVPARALNSGATIRVEKYDVLVSISDLQPGPKISPVGGVIVALPHGLEFQEAVSLVLTYDVSKVGPGQAVFVYYLNTSNDEPTWERMEGNIVGEGLVETKTNHFSTFSAMVTTAPPLYTAATYSLPEAPQLQPTNAPPYSQQSTQGGQGQQQESRRTPLHRSGCLQHPCPLHLAQRPPSLLMKLAGGTIEGREGK